MSSLEQTIANLTKQIQTLQLGNKPAPQKQAEKKQEEEDDDDDIDLFGSDDEEEVGSWYINHACACVHDLVLYLICIMVIDQ